MSGDAISRYVVQTQLGRGGMGEVYLAHDPVLERRVALKFLVGQDDADADTRQRLLREARAAAAIDHPFVCKIYEVGEAEGRPFIAMEYVDGETLHQRLARARLARDEAIQLALKIGEALACAHGRGIVHRDLKPANVMLTGDGHVKVMDFGLAKRVAGAESETIAHSYVTAAGTLLGTVEYMPPEQLRGEPVDERADIFALGVMLYQMLAGVHPFARATRVETAAAILHTDPPALTIALGAALDAVVRRMLAKAREDRIATIDEVRVELLRAQGAAAREPAPGTTVDTPVVAPRRRRGLVPAAIVAAALVAAAAGWVVVGGWPFRGGLHDVTSIVVMPATVVGSEADAFLADAVPNGISHFLVPIADLEIKRPPTSAEFGRVNRDVDRIAALYGVSAYVSSTVVVNGDRLNIDLQLTDAASRSLLWSRAFDGPRARYPDLMRECSESLRQALRPAAQSLLASAQPERSADVELLLQRGYYFSNLYKTRGREADFDRAREVLAQAAQLDPGRADVATAMGLLLNSTELTGARTPETVAEAERWTRKALDLDARSSTAWALLGELERIRPERLYARWLDYALKGAAYGPRDAYAHSRVAGALVVNSYTLGIAAASHAARLDPLLMDGPIYEAIAHMALNNAPAALARITHALSIEPDSLFALNSKVTILQRAGRVDEAEQLLQQLAPMGKAGRVHPKWLSFNQDLIAWHRAQQRGERAEMARVAARLRSLAHGEDPFPRWEIATQGIARAFALAGMREDALSLIQFRHLRGLIDPYDALIFDTTMTALAGDPRMDAMLDASRRRFDEMAAILEYAQQRGEVPDYLSTALRDLKVRIASVAGR